MKSTVQIALSTLILFSSCLASLFAQAPAQRQQPEFIKQGQQLMREGKMEEALALYRQILQSQPPSKAKAMAYSNMSQLKMFAEEIDGCIAWGNRAIEMAREIGDDEILCHHDAKAGRWRLGSVAGTYRIARGSIRRKWSHRA